MSYRAGMLRTAGLVVTMVVALTACSPSASADAVTSSSAGTPAGVQAPTASSSPAAATSEDPVVEPAPTQAPGFTITTQTRPDLKRYQRFRYQEARAVGLSAEATTAVDAAVSALVTRTVAKAVREGKEDCLVGGGQCGSFDATLTQLSCRDGYLCISQDVSALWPSSAKTYRTAETLVFDVVTGRRVALEDVVSAARMKQFLSSVGDALARFQRRHGITTDDLPNRLKPADIESWAPLRRGIRVWFDEFSAAPGFFGVVDVRVPYPG